MKRIKVTSKTGQELFLGMPHSLLEYWAWAHSDIAPKNAWDSVENSYAPQRIRSADVYVFCLFTSKDPDTANPMDLAQWEFYVLATSVLNELVPKQKSISLTSLQKLGAKKASFEDLYTAIQLASKGSGSSQRKIIDI
jgi:hypothetical protein